MDTNPCIARIENRDETWTVVLRFYAGSDTSTEVLIRPGDYAVLNPPIAFVPQVPLEIQLEVLLENDVDARVVTLWYEEIDAMYQFIYTVSPEKESSRPFPLYALNPTTPGKDVVLGIDYFGDGVVIVGTGDL